MRCLLAIVVSLAALATPATSRAESSIDNIGDLHGACRESAGSGTRKLYVVEVPRYQFAEYDRERGMLLVDTRRNFRVLRGSAEIFPTGLESIGFVANRERARELRTLNGAKLRLGFFLGYDGSGQPCVIRSAVAVTMVRADVAFVELVDDDGRVVAREDSDRLRAWLDDQERDAIPGEGPRGIVDVDDVPPALHRALGAAPLRAALAECHAAAVERGATEDGRMVLRFVPGEEPRVMISSLSDRDEEACVLRAVRPAVPSGSQVSIPLRFTR